MGRVVIESPVELDIVLLPNDHAIELPFHLCLRPGLLSTLLIEASFCNEKQSVLRCLTGQKLENRSLSAQS